jgi:hypothetical protein
MSGAVTIAAYARSRSVSPSTVQFWIREKGAPTVRRGKPGQATYVDADELDRWRGGGGFSSERIAAALWDVWMRDGGEGEPAWRTLGIERRAAAGLLLLAYERIVGQVNVDEIPEVLRNLLSNVYDS